MGSRARGRLCYARRPPTGAAPLSAITTMQSDDKTLVSVIMGSKSDWETLRHADETLTRFAIPHECLIVSAHRTPEWMREFALGAQGRGTARGRPRARGRRPRP